jgi:hypothetical protein
MDMSALAVNILALLHTKQFNSLLAVVYDNVNCSFGINFFSDNDEPLLSGSGVVSKDVTDENLLDSWRDVLRRWHQNLRQRPKQVQSLVRKGIPEALRGEVWQLLAGCTENNDLLEAYRTLITRVHVISNFYCR